MAARAAGLNALAAVALERMRDRRHPRRIAYIGAVGEANLGDEAMVEAARLLFPDACLIPYRVPWREARLAQLGLSGPRYFDRVFLGGGTLIGPYWLPFAQSAVESGARVATLGTGVGSSGFREAGEVAVAPWADLLAKMTHVGLRGPRSEARLRAIGVARAEVVGDLALALTRPEPAREAPALRVLVNVAVGDGAAWDAGPLPGLVPVLREIVARGGSVVPVAMHDSDVAPLEALLAASGLAGAPVHQPATAADFFALAGPCRCALAVRLHAAILSTCVGVPPLMLGYRDKCLDFMEWAGLEAWHVGLEGADADRVGAAARELLVAAPDLRGTVHAAASRGRESLRAYAARVLPPR